MGPILSNEGASEGWGQSCQMEDSSEGGGLSKGTYREGYQMGAYQRGLSEGLSKDGLITEGLLRERY